MTRARLVLIALVSMLITVPAFAQGPGPAASPAGFTVSPAALAGDVAGQSVDQQQWQRQYDAAKARQKRATKRIFIGLGVVLGGAVLAGAGLASGLETDSHCSGTCGSSVVALIGAAASVAGGVTFWWGMIDRAAASGSVSTLEATRPPAGPSKTVALTEHQALHVSIGARTSVGYCVAW
jgi:hypothetical protein